MVVHMRKVKTTVCFRAKINPHSFWVHERRKRVLFSKNHQQVFSGSNQTLSRYRKLAREGDGCPRCQDDKAPAWRDGNPENVH